MIITRNNDVIAWGDSRAIAWDVPGLLHGAIAI